MRILHVTREIAGDARYGIGKSLAPLTDAQRRQGHAVWWFDQAHAARIPPGRLAVAAGRMLMYVTRSRHGDEAAAVLAMVRERFAVAWAAVRFARQQHIDVMHCHDPLLAWACRAFARIVSPGGDWRFRLGFSAHGFGRYVQERPGVAIPPALLGRLQSLERNATLAADFVIAPSQSGLASLARDLELTAIPSHWRAIVHPRPVLAAHDRNTVRNELGLPGDACVALAVGQLIPMKRFALLVRACGRLTPANRPFLVILGEGDEAALRAAANTAGMADCLRIAVTDDISRWLAAADLYVSASATESYGMANVEALHAGLPAICTAVGAVPEIAGDGACLVGRHEEQGREDDEELETTLATALETLVVDAGARAALSAKARQRVATWPDADEVAGMVEAAYLTIAPGRNGGPHNDHDPMTVSRTSSR